MADDEASGSAVTGRRGRPVPGDPAVPDAQPVEATGTVSDEAGSLATLRARIDEIDREIVSLLNERAEIALEIGRRKQASGRRAIRDPLREQQVIEQVTRASAGLFPEPELVALYRTLIAATRKVQSRDRTAARARRGAAEPDHATSGLARSGSSTSALAGAAPEDREEPSGGT